MAAVCRERDIWLHVDGAYGLAALAAPRMRAAFAGIELADSFIVDPHKWLFAPYDCCALLYRDPRRHGAHSQSAPTWTSSTRGTSGILPITRCI